MRLHAGFVEVLALFAVASTAWAQNLPQTPGPKNAITDVPGIEVGHYTASSGSGGSGGANHTGAQGELAPTLRSSHVFICGGSKCTAPGPRYWNHERCRPLLLRTLP